MVGIDRWAVVGPGLAVRLAWQAAMSDAQSPSAYLSLEQLLAEDSATDYSEEEGEHEDGEEEEDDMQFLARHLAQAKVSQWWPADQAQSAKSEPREDLLDPKADEDNAAWVAKNLRRDPRAKSDALLSCPGCFATVCLTSERCSTTGERGEVYRSSAPLNCHKLEEGDAAVRCAQCSAVLGVELADGEVEFREVLPSAI